MADINVTPALNPFPLKENEGGALNLTRFAGIGAALVAVLTTVNGSWKAIFGGSAPNWAKPAVLMVVIGAWALIAVADILGRGYAAARRYKFMALPRTIPATDVRGKDEDCEIIGVRVDPDDEEQLGYLVVKASKTPEWVPGASIEFRESAVTAKEPEATTKNDAAETKKNRRVIRAVLLRPR
jgi:hypothetical protein